jgi:ATP adenylyltransferase/5',5'''-P-1,P-4-tetraphosphate phosphorylase II
MIRNVAELDDNNLAESDNVAKPAALSHRSVYLNSYPMPGAGLDRHYIQLVVYSLVDDSISNYVERFSSSTIPYQMAILHVVQFDFKQDVAPATQQEVSDKAAGCCWTATN